MKKKSIKDEATTGSPDYFGPGAVPVDSEAKPEGAGDTRSYKISEAEWAVLDILWQRGPVSASQVRTSLAEKTGWSLGAVRSFLNRLIAKGVVRLLDDEPIYRYEPVFDRETLLRQESTGFLEKHFGGTVSALVAHFLKNEEVPADEIKRLKKLLNDYEKKEQ